MSHLVQQAGEFNRGMVERIGDDDRAAESELIDRYGRGVRLILLKRTGDSQLANDLCQDTFVIILRKLRAGELRQPDSLAAFIAQTAVNLSIQHYRKEKRYVHSSDGIIGLHTAHNDRKEEKLDHETTRLMLEGVLEQMGVVRDREILRRYYLSDDDKQRICQDLQLTSVHFDRVLFRAKQRMRELIDQQPGLKAILLGELLDA